MCARVNLLKLIRDSVANLDDVEKIKRLYQWCDDINAVQSKVKFTALYVKQEEYEKYKPSGFAELINNFSK